MRKHSHVVLLCTAVSILRFKGLKSRVQTLFPPCMPQWDLLCCRLGGPGLSSAQSSSSSIGPLHEPSLPPSTRTPTYSELANQISSPFGFLRSDSPIVATPYAACVVMRYICLFPALRQSFRTSLPDKFRLAPHAPCVVNGRRAYNHLSSYACVKLILAVGQAHTLL